MPELTDAAPEIGEYLALRKVCGLGRGNIPAARTGPVGGLFAVTVRVGERLIGMARIVGYGGAFAQVTDIAVYPDWRGQGLGCAIMVRLAEWCVAERPASCLFSLISDPPPDRLYAQFGSEPRLGRGRAVG